MRHRTGELAGVTLTASDQPQRPPLTSGPAPLPQWTATLNDHPGIRIRQQILETAADNRDSHWSDRIESSFTVAQRLDRRTDASGIGAGLVAGITFEVPLAALGDRTSGSAEDARYRQAQEQLRADLDQLRRYLEDNLQRYHDALDDVAEAREQLELARRLSTERQQRLAVDSESGYMALRSARVEEAEAHLNLFRAWRGALQERAGLMRVAEHAANTDELLGSEFLSWPLEGAVSTRDAALRGVYVWDSHPLLGDPEIRGRHLRAMADAGLNRIYLGLDSAQAGQPAALQAPIGRLVSAAGDLGMEVDLLLGEPLWLTAEHRQDLIELIRRLSPLPFSGLHLDLEVEQLGWPVPEQRLERWLETLAAVSSVSPWPVSLVSHHRWFSGGEQPRTCVPCALQQFDIRDVSLMIYTTRPERAGELMAQAAERWPDLSFRLVQSVESLLPATQSWHGQTTAELKQVMEGLGNTGITDIEWQDWRHHPAYPDSTPQSSRTSP